MKKFLSLIMVLALVLCMATVALADGTEPQTYYTGTVSTEGWNYGLELPFTAPGAGVVTITVSNVAPGYDIGDANLSNWKTGTADGAVTFDVTAGQECVFQFYGWDGTSDCTATYDVVVTYTGEGTISEYVPAVPGETQDNPIAMYMPVGSVTVPANTTYYVMYTPMGMGGSPLSLTVTGNTGFMVASFPAMGMPTTANDVEGVAALDAQYNNFMWGYLFAIQNNTDSEQTYGVTLAQKPGTSGNPDELVIGVNTAVTPGDWNGYYYLWTAEEAGTLTITMPETGWTYMIMVNGEMTTDVQLYFDDEVVVASQAVEVAAYDQVIVWVNSYDAENMWDMNPAVELSFTAEFEVKMGTENNPISVNVPEDLTSATVGAGEEVWYAVSSRLDGYTLTVEGADAYVIVNGEKVEAVDGVVTVTLEAKSAMIPVVIGNAGEAEAAYECEIAMPDTTNPGTGDMIAAALVLMLTSGAALVGLKKKEN